MFLIGGPAYSGTTLFTHLLNQGDVTCLSEPDIHDPNQNHNGLEFLASLFPTCRFPNHPGVALGYRKSLDLLVRCERIMHPRRLGFKSCNWVFVEYAKLCRERGFPVVAIVRDIRDTLMKPLPPWVGGEKGLNLRYRLIWNHLALFDLWFRYEDLVRDPDNIIGQVSRVLGYPFRTLHTWDREAVPRSMLWEQRHQLLLTGFISHDRVGMWTHSEIVFSDETHETARLMGYA